MCLYGLHIMEILSKKMNVKKENIEKIEKDEKSQILTTLYI